MTRSDLLELIGHGENSGVEFKSDDVRPEQLAKEVVALTNFQGGRILLGVEDDGTITGIRRGDLERWVIDTVFGRKVHPMILPFYEEIQVDDQRRVAVVSVTQGATKPYVVRHNDREDIYVRAGSTSRLGESWCTEVGACRDLLKRVVEQTERRVFAGETVPASEKVVSLFEPHTDIICKGGRQTHYGHKINLSTGRSALVVDVVVESGNPADSERCLPMLRRHVETYGEPPQRVAFDGGYASRANLADAKKLGVEHVMFHKKRGLKADDMTPSAWIYGQLKRFRAGVEAGISYLKRCFGLDRCRWRGWEHFQAYVHSAVFAHNLLRLVRLQPS